jgi:hypothetical protein
MCASLTLITVDSSSSGREMLTKPGRALIAECPRARQRKPPCVPRLKSDRALLRVLVTNVLATLVAVDD